MDSNAMVDPQEMGPGDLMALRVVVMGVWMLPVLKGGDTGPQLRAMMIVVDMEDHHTLPMVKDLLEADMVNQVKTLNQPEADMVNPGGWHPGESLVGGTKEGLWAGVRMSRAMGGPSLTAHVSSAEGLSCTPSRLSQY
eukprot:jgi/Mesen1/5305/ME000264S04332